MTDSRSPRIALISAVPNAMGPAAAALRTEFEDPEIWNLLDDRLLSDADRAGGVDASLSERMAELITIAESGGADAVLLTCSLYGFVAEAHPSPLVLAPDQAMFDDVAAAHHASVLVIASIPSALEDSVERLSRHLAARGSRTIVRGVTPAGALETSRTGSTSQLAAVIAEAVAAAEPADAVLLAQYSLAPAAAELARALATPVYTGPASAARLLRDELRP